MTSFAVLLKKELRHQLRTYRLLIVLAIFFVFGLGTPLLFHYLPVLLPAQDIVVIPQFTTTDVVTEYIDTISQIGLMAAILVAMGAVARERESGTAALTMSKPVGCAAFITAKLAALTLVFAIAMAIGGLGCYLYILLLFGNAGVLSFLAANLVTGLYLLVCLAITVMYSSFFQSQLAAGGLALLTLIGLTATSGLPVLRDYSPGALVAWSKSIASGGGQNAWFTVVVSLAVTVLSIIIGWQVFQRKEL